MSTPEHLYCDRAAVVAELPVGGIISPGAITAGADPDANTLESDGHGFETDMPVTVRTVDGVADAELPAPLVAGTTYYVKRLTNALFQLAATQGGAAINLTTEGTEVVVAREPKYDETIEFYSRWVDDLLPSEAVPLEEPINPLIRGVVARLSAKRLMNVGGQDSAVVTAEEISSKAIVERHAAGIPVRGTTTKGSTNKAISARGLDSSRTDPRGWGVGGV